MLSEGASAAVTRALAAVLAVLAAIAVVTAADSRGFFLPSWASWEERSLAADLDSDGADELLSLSGGRFAVWDGDRAACGSDGGWLVQDVAVGDVDGDGCPEAVSLVWKRGSFGVHRPFWVERDEQAISQHVFIHRYAGDALEPVWMSSALGIEVAEMQLGDDGSLHLSAPDGSATTWAWLGWGLTLVEEPAGGERREAGSPVGESGWGEPATGAAIRSGSGEDPAEPASRSELTFLAVGDNIAHTGVYEGAWLPAEGRYDFTPIYAQVKERISGYDVAVVVQETILVADPADRSDFPLFGTPVAMGDALVDAGFDVVCAATNHAADKGERGMADTVAFWRERHPEVVLLGLHGPEDAGGPRASYLERNGIRLALLDFTEGLNGRPSATEGGYAVDTLDDESAVLAAVAAAEEQADLTICFLHIGEEYASAPTDYQRSLAAALADAGADVVICSHPHIAQEVGEAEGDAGGRALVFWSLGNFMSNQMDPATMRGLAASLRIVKDESGARVEEWEALPTLCRFDESGTRVSFL